MIFAISGLTWHIARGHDKFDISIKRCLDSDFNLCLLFAREFYVYLKVKLLHNLL